MKWQNKLATDLKWGTEISHQSQKTRVAAKVAQFVKDGDVIGAGSGSTSFIALQSIAKRIKEEDLNISAIPTSKEVEMNCAILGVPTTTLMAHQPDWGFDGADEVDGNKRLIKGRGGAMLAEKLVMASSPKTYILVDESKFVKRLGASFPVPVEVDARAVHLVEDRLSQMETSDITLRKAAGKDGPVITEAGNLILDVRFDSIEGDMEERLAAIPGVVETGLFFHYPIDVLTD
ncbi:ribose 5-phosphate isomerase A [Thalassobacillus sp. CUG 92003]|uniref:ribose 5-phosphate isomerase A n=1 Tax=Thalassobacillus sp. CUG 92003 TaxID=2736641 RepID=UPI0015E7324C|nr:ribose 5-phosphate isomerase A [Thalassobacillus sp. CUG 92003]